MKFSGLYPMWFCPFFRPKTQRKTPTPHFI